MRDIPVFATDNGVGSLMLKEVPYKQTAYVKIHDATEAIAFLEECVGFCRAVGAEHIYATGHDCLQAMPLHTVVVKMRCTKTDLPKSDAVALKVTKMLSGEWLDIYSKRMRSVPGAASIGQKDMDNLLSEGKVYFVHKNEMLIGIGIVAGCEIEALASVQQGTGKDVLLALCNVLSTDSIELEVSTDNERAMRLYKSVGFSIFEEKLRWYKVF